MSRIRRGASDLADEFGRFFQSMQQALRDRLPPIHTAEEVTARLLDDRNEEDLWRALYAYIYGLEQDSHTPHKVAIYNQRLASYSRIKIAAGADTPKEEFLAILQEERKQSLSPLLIITQGKVGSQRFANYLQEFIDGLNNQKFTFQSVADALESTELDRRATDTYGLSPRT